jgi:jumonji domain-containing protein 7
MAAKGQQEKKSRQATVRQAWRTLSEDTGDFWIEPRLPVFNVHMAAPVDFAREVYSRYHPAILVGMTDHWPASELWTKDYLLSKLGDRRVAINLTPDGMADSIQSVCPMEADEKKEYFVYPAEVEMTMSEFYALLDRHKGGEAAPVAPVAPVIPYLSQQNDNLRQHLPELLEDIDLYVPIAREVFGTDYPEAVNLWIGDERSISSMHKDHFENLYFVISGEKTFTLLPPSDCIFVPEATYPTARYVASNSSPCAQRSEGTADWTLSLTTRDCPVNELTWTPLDPNQPTSVAKYPQFAKYAHPIQVTVSAGECLYIPAMWYHRVSQNELTVSVNFWYDQRFDFRYVFFKSIQSMMMIAKANTIKEGEVEEEEEEDEDEEEDIGEKSVGEREGDKEITSIEEIENFVESYSGDV